MQCPSSLWNDYATGTCVSSCQNNQLADHVAKTCKNCDANCMTCVSSINICSSCPVNKFIDHSTGQCVSNCPDGYYGDSFTKKCELCDLDCKTCDGAKNACTSCPNNLIKTGQSCNPPNCIFFYK